MDIRYFACDTILDMNSWVSAIESELNRLKINLLLTPVDEKTLALAIPGTEEDLSCDLVIGLVDESFTTGFQEFDFPVEAGRDSLLKESLLTLTGDREHWAVNFIFNLMTKVLGRITQGTMVDVEQEYVTDDWVTWGYDYVDGDMFEEFNCVGLDDQYPALRCSQ